MFINNDVNSQTQEGKGTQLGFYEEYPHISGIYNIARDIAQRLYTRHRLGGIEYIIAEQPHEMLVLIEKRWRRMTQQVLKKRASAKDAEQIIELTRQVTYMQNLKLTEHPWDEFDAIAIVASNSVKNLPPICSGMFIASPLLRSEVQLISSRITTPGFLVTYDSLTQ